MSGLEEVGDICPYCSKSVEKGQFYLEIDKHSIAHYYCIRNHIIERLRVKEHNNTRCLNEAKNAIDSFEQVLFDDSIKKPIKFYEVRRYLLTSIIRLDEVYTSTSLSGYFGFFEKRRLKKNIKNSRRNVYQLADIYNSIPSRYAIDITEIDDSMIDNILNFVIKNQIEDFRDIAKETLYSLKDLYNKIKQAANNMSLEERESMYKKFRNYEKLKKLKVNNIQN